MQLQVEHFVNGNRLKRGRRLALLNSGEGKRTLEP
jgi:hypothetical protein